MQCWIVLFSLLLNALFAPQFSILCTCPPPQSVDAETCPCCAAGECDCGIAPSNPSALPAKDPFTFARVGEVPPATLEFQHHVAFAPKRPPLAPTTRHSTSRHLSTSASEHRALLCQWQT